MNYGLADYVPFSPCPYPAVVDQFGQIPAPVGVAESCACSRGLGMFEAGLNVGQWGVTEWAIVAGGLYFLVSAFNDTKSASRRIGRTLKSRSAKASRRAKLQQELASL